MIDEIHIDLGGRIPHRWIDARRETSTLDLVADGFTLFVGPGTSAAIPVSTDGDAPVTVRELPGLAARALGIAPGGSLLVRPSGEPARLATEVTSRTLAA